MKHWTKKEFLENYTSLIVGNKILLYKAFNFGELFKMFNNQRYSIDLVVYDKTPGTFYIKRGHTLRCFGEVREAKEEYYEGKVFQVEVELDDIQDEISYDSVIVKKLKVIGPVEVKV